MTKLPQVVVLYNQPVLPPGDVAFESEAGVLESVVAISAALRKAGHVVDELPVGKSITQLVQRLTASQLDVAVNLCEGFDGYSGNEPHIAAILELLHISYTGSPPQCLALTRNKADTKRLLAGSSIATPAFAEVVRGGLPSEDIRMLLERGPLIVKPAAEDASLGIGPQSVVNDWPATVRQIQFVHETYGDALVEHFVAGREFNVGIIELSAPQVLPIAEIEFRTSAHLPWPILTYDGKWSPQSEQCQATPVSCPAPVDGALALQLEQVAMAAYRVTGCRDYARIDMRVNGLGEVFVLEVNANPDAGPSAGLARMLQAASISYDEFARRLVATAMQRQTPQAVRPIPPHNASTRHSESPFVRPLTAADHEPLLELTRATAVFRPDEIEIADELLRDALRDSPDGHYQVLVIESERRAAGWSCHGRVPLTDATFDLYWIVVDPKLHGRGLGRYLLAEVERQVAASGGRWLLAETSSTDLYQPTREFYKRCGYKIVSEINDFYRPGDGKITFGKRLD